MTTELYDEDFDDDVEDDWERQDEFEGDIYWEDEIDDRQADCPVCGGEFWDGGTSCTCPPYGDFGVTSLETPLFSRPDNVYPAPLALFWLRDAPYATWKPQWEVFEGFTAYTWGRLRIHWPGREWWHAILTGQQIHRPEYPF